MLKKTYICIIPFEGQTFKEMFSEKNNFFVKGESENPFRQLSKQLEQKNIILIAKEDVPSLKGQTIHFIFHFGQVGYEMMSNHKSAINVYVASEPAAIDFAHSEHRLKKLANYFDYILTWNDNLVDSNIFIKFNYLIDFSINKVITGFEDRKLITNISANKKTYHPDELYSKRHKAIQHFTDSDPLNFDLYGFGWDKEGFSTYRGTIPSKRSTLAKYKFSLCFENQAKTKGYITEKIWDCLLCGTVPIYWGADNITKYVPKKCFIDYRDYLNVEKLHTVLASMSKEEWEKYINNIDIFLAKSKDGPFSANAFAQVIEEIVYRDKRIRVNPVKIFCLRFIKHISKFERVYRVHGLAGSYRRYKEIWKLKSSSRL